MDLLNFGLSDKRERYRSFILRIACRVRTEEAELMGPPFILPAEALSPQATGEAPMAAPKTAGVQQNPADGLDDLFGPAIPVPGSEFLAGTGLETLEAPATDYSAFGESSLGNPFKEGIQPPCTISAEASFPYALLTSFKILCWQGHTFNCTFESKFKSATC